MRQKKQIKQQPRYFYGFTRKNKAQQINNKPTQNIVHILQPVSISKISTLLQKFQQLFQDPIHNGVFKKRFEDLFQFMVQKNILFDQMGYDMKSTGYVMGIKGEYTRKYTKRDSQKTVIIKQLIDKMLGKVQDENKQNADKRQEKIIIFNQMMKSKLKEYEKKIVKRQLMDLYNKQQINQQDIKNFKKQYGFEYHKILNNLQILDRLQMVKPSNQMLRYKKCAQKYKYYYETQYIQQTNSRPYTYCIKIKRYSSQQQPILIELNDLIQLRQQGINYNPQSINCIKDVLLQLKKYNIQTGNTFYQYLNPQNIIIDQISLSPKLSYTPIILQAFGLKKKPYTLQCRLALFPTPKQFDYFQSQAELDSKKRIILDDPYFGEQKYYSKLTEQHKKYIAEQKKQILKIREQVCVDRFLLTCHKIIKGKQFGKLSDQTIKSSNSLIESNYIDKLKRSKQKIQKDIQKLNIFIGEQYYNNSIKQFRFKFNDLLDYFESEQKDSIIQQWKYQKKQSYINFKYEIVRQIIFIMSNKNMFAKIINAKRYMIIYFILVLQYLDQMLTYIIIDNDKFDDIPKIKIYLDQNGKKFRSGRGIQHSFESTLDKIKKYKINDKTHKYFDEDEIGKMYIFTLNLSQQIKKIKLQQQQLIKYIQSPKKQQNFRDNIKDKIKVLEKNIKQMYQKYKNILIQFYIPQLQTKYLPSGPHVFKDQNSNVILFYKIITRRFALIIYAFLTLKPTNHINYITICNMFKMQQIEPIITQKTINKQMYDNELSCLQVIDDHIGYLANNKSKFQYLSDNKQIEIVNIYKKPKIIKKEPPSDNKPKFDFSKKKQVGILYQQDEDGWDGQDFGKRRFL